MQTDTDYWLENIPLDIALAYVEGDMDTVRRGEDRNHRKDDAFSRYAPTWTGQAPKCFARIGRKAADGTFFIVTPSMAAALAAHELEVSDLTAFAEPEVVRVELERLPAGGVMMTYLDPLTKQQRSSGGRLESAMPWLFAKYFEQVLAHGPMYNLSQQEQMEIGRRLERYTDAIMLKYFTLDLDYPMETILLDVAHTLGLDFQGKLDLLRGELRDYKELGVPNTLVKELLSR